MDDLIYSYTDKEAVNDGIIHILSHGHRVTNNALGNTLRVYIK